MNSKSVKIDLNKFTLLYDNFWTNFLLEIGKDSNNELIFKDVNKFRNEYWKQHYGLFYKRSRFYSRNKYYVMFISDEKKLNYIRIKYGF
jgi:hypothetical protein